MKSSEEIAEKEVAKAKKWFVQWAKANYSNPEKYIAGDTGVVLEPMIRYAKTHTTATLDTLKERVEETKDNPMMPDEFISKKEVLNLIDEVRNE